MPSEVPSSSSGDPRPNQIIAKYLESVEAGNEPNRDELLTAHPEYAESLKAFFANRDQMRDDAAPQESLTIPPHVVELQILLLCPGL
jgi:hypothetical protein